MSWSSKYEGLISCVGIEYPEKDFVSLKSTHSLRLATYRFHVNQPKALVFVFHGLHKASSDMALVARVLFQNGFAVAAFDQEGQGDSEGQRGTFVDIDDQVADCIQFIEKTKLMYPANVPVFCIGVTLGGALCVKIGLKRPDLLNGVVLYGPTLELDPNFNPFIQKTVRLLNWCCCKNLRLKAVDQSANSQNPHYASYCYDNPGFFSGKLNVKTAYAIIRGLRELKPQLERFKCPFILFHGEKDKMKGASSSSEFCEKCQAVDKEIVFYPEMNHAVVHEPEFKEILQKTVDWIRNRS